MAVEGTVPTKLTSIAKASKHNVSVTGGADILPNALLPTNPPCLFRVAAGFDSSGFLSITITKGGNTQVQKFNEGNTLTADCLYMFDSLVHKEDSINYRYSTGGAQLQTLRVQEIDVGTQ